MSMINVFNLTHPIVTIPITIIMGFIFITVLFNNFKKAFLSKLEYKRLNESGFFANIKHLIVSIYKWVMTKVYYIVGVFFFSMTLLFSIMVLVFQDKTFQLDFTAYMLCAFISIGLSVLFYTYRDSHFDLKTYKQVRQEQKEKKRRKV